MRCLLTLFFAFCLGVSPLWAQQSERPARLLTLAGDTLPGYVLARAEQDYRTGLNFRPTTALEPIFFAPVDIRGFLMDDGRVFHSIEASYPLEAEADSLVKRRELAKALALGRVDLYVVQQSAQADDQAFFAVKDGEVHPLIFAQRMVAGNRRFDDRRYVGTLKNLARDCPALWADFDRVPFRAGRLAAAVRSYNRCVGEEESFEVIRADLPMIVQHGISGGLGRTGFVGVPNRLAYSLSYSLVLFKSGLSRNFGLRMGLNYFALLEPLGTDLPDPHFLLGVPFFARFQARPQRVAAYGALGLEMLLYDGESVLFSPQIGGEVGVIFWRRFDLGCQFTLLPDYNSLRLSGSYLQARLGLLLNGPKAARLREKF